MAETDYVNPQANVIEDDDVKKSVSQGQTTPKFNFQNAQPLKTIPQLSTNRSARYQRPETEEERGQATADLFTGKPSGMEQERRAVQGPETTAGISTLLGGGTEAFGNFVPYFVAAMRGIEANKEHPATTGDPFKDMMNSLHDNAMRGIFEPETTEPTSVHILNNPGLFGKTNPQTAAVFGTLAEFHAAMITNPLSIIPEGLQTLSRENQNRLLFNKITQSSHWGDNITAMASKMGTTWQKVLPKAQRELWTAITKGNYLQVALKNLELYQPFQLKGLSTEDINVPEIPQTLRPTIKAGDKTEIGVDHEEALNKIGMSKDTHVEGKDFQAGFTTPTGEFITREQAKLPPWSLPNGHSEDIPKKDREQAVQSETVAPYEVEQPTAPKKLINMRQSFLENKSSSIDAQMRDLEAQQKRLRDNGLSTGRIDAKLDKLGKDWLSNESQIAENMIGQVKINELKNEIGQTKISNIINDVQDAEEKGIKEGMRKGLVLGKEKGRIEEVQRKAALQAFSKYKKNAVDEMNGIAKNLQNIKDGTEGLPLEYKKQLDDILSNFDLKKRSSKTLADRKSLSDFISRAKANGDDINIPEDVINTASQTPLNDLTVNQMRDLNNMVGQIYRMGKLKNKLIESKGLRDLESVVKESVDKITSSKGIEPTNNFVKEMIDRDKSLAEQVAQGKWKSVKNLMISNMMPELQFIALDGWEPSTSWKNIFLPIHEANNNNMDALDVANKKMEDIFGYRKPKDWHQFVQVGDRKLKLSEMMFIYANAANDANRADLLKYGVTEEDIDNVEKALPDEDKMAVRKLWQYFDKDQFPRLFKERYSLEGVSTKKEDNYFPITNLENLSTDEDLEWERTYREATRKGTVDKGMLKARTGGAMAFTHMDFFGTIGRSVDRAEHYLAYARVIRNANKYFNHPSIKQAINQKFGNHYLKTLQKWVQDAARGRPAYDNDLFSKLSRASRLNLAPAVLGLNLLTAAKQFTGLLYGMEMAGKSATIKALPNLLLKYGKVSKEIDAESTMMRNAGMRQERELEEIYSQRGFFEKTGKLSGYHRFQQVIMWPTQQADLLIRRAIYQGTKQALKDRGVTDKKELVTNAERVVRRTQPMGGLIYLPDVFRGGEGAKQISFLKIHVNKFYNIQLEMLAKMANGKMSAGQKVSGMLFNNIFPMLLLGYIERRQIKSGWDFATSESAQLTQGIPVVQDIFDSIRDGRWEFQIPLVEYMGLFGRVISAKKPGTKLKRTLEAGATAAGLPVVGTERLLKGQPFGGDRQKKFDKDFNSNRGTVDLMK